MADATVVLAGRRVHTLLMSDTRFDQRGLVVTASQLSNHEPLRPQGLGV